MWHRWFKKFLRLFLTTLIYLGLFGLMTYLFGLINKHDPAIWAAVVTIVFISFFHEHITYDLVRSFIDRNFYRQIFDITNDLKKFNQELNATLDSQLLIEKIAQFLQNTFGRFSWAFYLRREDYYDLISCNRVNTTLPVNLELHEPQEQKKLLELEVQFYPVGQLIERKQLGPKLGNLLNELPHWHFIVPLNSFKDQEGFLLFGKEISTILHFRSFRDYFVHILSKMADVIENARLYSEVKRKSLQNHLLWQTSLQITSSLNLNDVLSSILDAVKKLVDYDAAGIFLIDRKHKLLRRMATRGYDQKLLDKIQVKLNLGISGEVIRTRKPVIINDVSKNRNYYAIRQETRSQLTIPLLIGGKPIGVMVLESNQLNHFTQTDLEMLLNFANQATIAINNAQLYEDSLQKKRLESDLIIASKVQQALLPTRPPKFPGLKIATLNLPSRFVGGDYFDVFRIRENQLGISIGDVSGKGAPGAILMAALYAGFKSLLKEIYPVVEVVARLNNFLTETTSQGYYATFFFGIYEHPDKKFTYTNAGHNPPILYRRDGSIKKLTTGGIVLGFLADQEYRQEQIQLQSGDYLVFYTDGVTEVKNSRNQEFGEERLIRFLKKHYGKHPRELKSLLLEEIKKFSRKKDFPDDLTLIIVLVE